MNWIQIKKLKEDRGQIIGQMRAMLEKADAEKRSLDSAEQTKFDELNTQAEKLAGDIANGEKVYSLEQSGNVRSLPGRDAINAPAQGPTEWRDATGRPVNVYTNNKQRMSIATERTLSAGKAIRGLITGDWSNAEDEQRAVQLSAGGLFLPASVVAGTFDAARDQSVITQAGAIVVTMDTPSLDIAKLTTAPTAVVKTEGSSFGGTVGALGRLTLSAGTIMTEVEVSRELMADAPNAAAVIDEAIATALANQLDTLAFTAIAAGSGVNTVATIGAVTDYSDFVDAWSQVLQDGGRPNAYAIAADVAGVLEGLTNTDGSYKQPPTSIAALAKFISPAIVPSSGVSNAYLGDFRKVVIGLRQDALVEMSNAPGFDKHTVKVKLTYRGDIDVTKPTHFCVLQAIDTTP